MQLKINKYNEQDYVGRETIDLINKEAETMDIDQNMINHPEMPPDRAQAILRTEGVHDDDPAGQDLQRIRESIPPQLRGSQEIQTDGNFR